MLSNKVNYVLFVLLALFWSGSFLGIKITIEHCPPIFSAMVRIAISFVLLTIIFISMRKPLQVSSALRWRLWLAGLFTQALPFILLFYGEQFIAPALASIINSTVSLWAFLITIFILRDKVALTYSRAMGLMIGLGGVSMIFWPQIHDGMHTALFGLLAVLGMAFLYAIGSLLTKRLFSGKINLYANLWHQHCGSLTFLLLMSLCFEHWPSIHILMNVHLAAAFLYLGLFSTAIAWIIYFHLIRAWDPVRASSVMYAVPLLSIMWDYLFLHLLPGWNEFVGAVLILLGVTLIQLQRKSAWQK
jgi:drug/metabolite transporter (DMT)-like permease